MELILPIAVGLTIWRLSKYFTSRTRSTVQPTSFPAETSSRRFDLALDQTVLREKRRIWIKYQDAEGRVSQRRIEIYHYDTNYIFAWCCLRNEPRTFKRNNILQWKLLNEQFQSNPPVDQYIREQLLPKDWSNKVPWGEWQSINRVRQAPTARNEVNAKDDSFYWTGPGKVVSLNGFKILKGGIYVGTGLRALNEFNGAEPALIDPKMPVDRLNPDKSGKNAPYWPSYSELSPESRAGYLEWISAPQQSGDVHVGFPFLFLYGLERRLFGKGNPLVHEKSELEFMQREVTALLHLYGKIDSFQKYSTSFLDIVEICRDQEGLYRTSPPTDKIGDCLPARVQVVISQFAVSGDPLPVEWALSWALCHPEARLRMPARRCRDEFKELFHIRYKDEFKAGIQIRPGKGMLKLQYRPASPSFGKELLVQTALPQVPSLRTIPAKLVEIVERCSDELDAYSRCIGNKHSAESDLSSIALLPVELVRQHQGRASLEFRAWIEERFTNSDFAIISGETLLHRWGRQDKSSKADCVLLSQVLEKWDYGMEPDVRFGGPSLRKDAKVVLFRLPQGFPTTPSPEYTLASVLLQLGVTVAMADGVLSSDEEHRLEQQIETILKIGAADRQRLRAHLRWLCIEERALTGLATVLIVKGSALRDATVFDV